MSSYHDVGRELHSLGNLKKVADSERFFKTKKGEYAAGDRFLGVTVPETRSLVKKYQKELSLNDIERLLRGKFHEERLFALITLTERYRSAKDTAEAKKIFILYTKNTAYINNWDLVDTSAATVVGGYIAEHMRHTERLPFIDAYCKSTDLWKNRIIILASYYEIKKGNEKMNYYIARKLMGHKHDLIHKALGWMLREVGKRVGKKTLETFLEEHAQAMPRTMLRYAIEHLSSRERAYYMAK